MPDGLAPLGRAEQAAGAAGDGLALEADDFRTAHRALVGHLELARILRPARLHHADDFRDDVAGTAHDDPVADAHVQAPDLVLVVEGGVAHRHPAHLHRFQPCHRCHCAGAAHLHLDVQHAGHLFVGRELVGHGPARCPRHVAQPFLPVDAVHLVDHAVDLVGQIVAALLQGAVIGQAAFDPVHHPGLGVGADAPVPEPGHDLAVAAGQSAALHQAPAVTVELQRPLGRDAGIELAQAAGRGVARIGEGLFALFPLAPVEFLESGLGHHHLAAHLQDRRPALAQQPQRHAADGADVGSDVLAGVTVATGGPALQHAVAVQDGHGQAVQLGLGGIVHRFHSQALAHAAIEVVHLLVAEGVVEGEHGHLVAHLAEALQGLRPHALGGGVGRHELRPAGFELLQLAHEAVVLGIRDLRLVEHVIEIVVVIDLAAQRLHAPPDILGDAHAMPDSWFRHGITSCASRREGIACVLSQRG